MDQDQKWNVQNTENGNYKIYCWTKNGGKRFMEAYPKDGGYARPSIESQTRDQLWQITSWPSDNEFYRISCNTVNMGVKSLEAFQGDDIVKVRSNSLDQDQSWEIIPW
jgi:hypothetical protein